MIIWFVGLLIVSLVLSLGPNLVRVKMVFLPLIWIDGFGIGTQMLIECYPCLIAREY